MKYKISSIEVSDFEENTEWGDKGTVSVKPKERKNAKSAH